MAAAGPVRSSKKKGWFVYIVQCGDGSFYTGITTDLKRRIAEHNAGIGSAYTRSRRPVRLVRQERCAARSSALKREAAIKRLSREEKRALSCSKIQSG